jgi:hypothetical protein
MVGTMELQKDRARRGNVTKMEASTRSALGLALHPKPFLQFHGQDQGTATHRIFDSLVTSPSLQMEHTPMTLAAEVVEPVVFFRMTSMSLHTHGSRVQYDRGRYLG